jgi:toxin ParE1/3/4
MTPQFRLTEPAIKDIEQIADYIAKQAGLQQSESFLSKLDGKFAKIAQFPNLGRRRDEILPGLRSLPIDDYLPSLHAHRTRCGNFPCYQWLSRYFSLVHRRKRVKNLVLFEAVYIS